jgi:hypothetical protein
VIASNGSCLNICEEFQTSVNNVCVAQNCDERSPILSLGCGNGCYISSTNSLRCVSECGIFETIQNGTCEVESCSQRIPSNELKKECGEICMLTTQNQSQKCVDLNCSLITLENECFAAQTLSSSQLSCQWYEHVCYSRDEPVGSAGVYYVAQNGSDITGTSADLISCRNPNIRCNNLTRAMFGFFESTSSRIGILEGTYSIHPFQFTVRTLTLNGSLTGGTISVILNMELEESEQAIFVLLADGYKISLNSVN